MSTLILDNSGGRCVAALMDGGRLAEVILDGGQAVAGRIYQGVARSVQADRFAFVDIGLEKPGFLPLDGDPQPPKNGQELLVQAIKEPSAQKGAFLSRTVSLTGRYFVVLYPSPDNGVSHKITEGKEAARLKNLLIQHLPPGFGAIARTEAGGQEEETLRQELALLLARLEDILRRAPYAKAPACLCRGEAPYRRLLTPELTEIIVSQPEDAEALMREYPHILITLYQEDRPLLAARGVTAQIEKALERRVWLKSGASLVIDETEALAAVDVNSGKMGAKKRQREAVLAINLEACGEAARQIRLRNLSGMIVIDFIHMIEEADRQAVTEALKTALAADRLKTDLYGFSKMGLMELTRQKIGPPLSQAVKNINWKG